MKKFINMLLGMVFMLTVNTANAYEKPQVGELGKILVYKNEVYKLAQSQIVSIPFETEDFSLVDLDHYYIIADGGIIKGIMVVSIHNGPEFGYAVVDAVMGEGFGLIDINCDGQIDLKVPYDSDILIPDCLFEHKTHETG